MATTFNVLLYDSEEVKCVLSVTDYFLAIVEGDNAKH